MVEFVGDLEGVGGVHPKMVFDLPWSPEMMSEDAKPGAHVTPSRMTTWRAGCSHTGGKRNAVAGWRLRTPTVAAMLARWAENDRAG